MVNIKQPVRRAQLRRERRRGAGASREGEVSRWWKSVEVTRILVQIFEYYSPSHI